MKRWVACRLAAVLFALAMSVGLGAGGEARNRIAFRTFSVEGQHWGGPIEGPWEWSGRVTVTSADMTLTCDRLKLWPTKDGRDLARAEASGNIAIGGRYTAADGAEWKIMGEAAGAAYERKAAQAMLDGAVSFKATNAATGAVLSVEAEKLAYDVEARTFRFSRGADPVRLEWQEPQPEAPQGQPSEPSDKGDEKD